MIYTILSASHTHGAVTKASTVSEERKGVTHKASLNEVTIFPVSKLNSNEDKSISRGVLSDALCLHEIKKTANNEIKRMYKNLFI